VAVIDPVSAVLGVISMGSGIAGASAQNAAAQQQYKDALRYQKAQEQFSKWQSRFNAKATDAQNKFNYWQSVVQFNQNKAYVNSLRNFERVKAFNQAEVVFKTRAAAGSNYMNSSEALVASVREAEMQDAVALKQYQWRAVQARGSVQAMEREGKSVDRLINSYAQQLGDYESIMQINQGIRRNQYTRQQKGAIAQYLNEWNSQPFYQEQVYSDPTAPYAPLPTIVMPPPPSMTGAPPSAAAANLNIGTAVLGGLNTIAQGIEWTNKAKAGG
jgi:hypothetical protein